MTPDPRDWGPDSQTTSSEHAAGPDARAQPQPSRDPDTRGHLRAAAQGRPPRSCTRGLRKGPQPFSSVTTSDVYNFSSLKLLLLFLAPFIFFYRVSPQNTL